MSMNMTGPRIRDPEDRSIIWCGFSDGFGHFIGFGPMVSDELEGEDGARRVNESRIRCEKLGLFNGHEEEIQRIHDRFLE